MWPPASPLPWTTGHRVINLSLAGTTESLAVRDAIAYAVSKGVVVVAAAGNDNSAVARYPAVYDNVIAVGATTYTNDALDFEQLWS